MTPTFQDEVQLAGWSETHNGGAKVTFWLSDSTALEAFKRMTVLKGKTAGQRLACVLIEIGDDEKPVSQIEGTLESPSIAASTEKLTGLALLAVQWCNDAGFRDWFLEGYDAEAKTALRAKMNMLEMCGITSRKELSHNEDAIRIFDSSIRQPYMVYLNEENY